MALAQSTEFTDWTKRELVIFDDANKHNNGFFYQPNGKMIEPESKFFEGKRTVNLSEKNKIKFSVRRFDE